ncbi:MAG: SDR family oxidoreductase [Chloroflexi bacterium]|nr:SDR family oxidoreductase [Chloroflexota bacterium]
MRPLILVTGATGYIASRLIPRLLNENYRVRALARDPSRLQCRSWFRRVEVVPGDVMSPPSLASALEGVETAYYLIHNMSSGRGYTERELEGARNFAQAAENAGVGHIIYLGGLADPEQRIAPHMRSRIETGQALRQGKVPVTEFRAGVIAGSGSISFEMIRFITELCPIVPGPAWLNNKSQPIAVQNVIDYLLAALNNPNGRGGIFEVGGPEVFHYKDLMLKYARARGLQRRMVLLPYVPLWLMAFSVGLLTPVPRPIAHALIGGLSADSVVKHPAAQRVFPEVKLISFDAAAQMALQELSPLRIERVWDEDDEQAAGGIKHEGFFIHRRSVQIHAPLGKVFQALLKRSQKTNWRLEASGENERVLLRIENQRGGEKWLEWRVSRKDGMTRLSQIVFFAPRGLPGFLNWYLLRPFRSLCLRVLERKIERESDGV